MLGKLRRISAACARRLLDITFGVAIFALLLLILFLRLVTRMPDLDDIDG